MENIFLPLLEDVHFPERYRRSLIQIISPAIEKRTHHRVSLNNYNLKNEETRIHQASFPKHLLHEQFRQNYIGVHALNAAGPGAGSDYAAGSDFDFGSDYHLPF